MDESSAKLSALKRAIDCMKSQSAMARLCGVSQPAVNGWLHKIGELPAEHVLKVEAATGISKHDLRPDIYPRDAAASTASGDDVAGGGAGVRPSTGPRAETDSLAGLNP